VYVGRSYGSGLSLRSAQLCGQRLSLQVLHPVKKVVRGDDLGIAVDRPDSPEQVVSPLEIDWVDLKVTRITSTFTTVISVIKFLGGVPILKVDAGLDFFSIESCLPTETVCLGQSSIESPFFYMYICLFFQICTCLYLSISSR